MSLTMLLRSPEGIIMAADSRVTVGYTLEGPETRDDSVKFIQLNSDVGVMTYGLFDVGIEGINALKAEDGGDGYQELSLTEIIEKGGKIFKKASNEWTREHPDIKRKDKDIGFIIGGLDRQNMLFRSYNLESPDFIPKIITGNFFLAGQWHIARFLLTRLNGNKKATIETLKNLAAISMLATSAVDKTVGGPLRLASITKSSGFQWISDKEMKEVLDFNSSFNKFFQELLQSSLNAVLSG